MRTLGPKAHRRGFGRRYNFRNNRLCEVRRVRFRIILAGCLSVLAAMVGAAAAEGQPKGFVTPAAARAGSAMPEEYKIGPHDLLEITVFQVQELSRTVRVNSQGLISLPMIGAVQAGGLTAHELESALAKKLSENLLQDPQVSVFIKEFISQRVVVEGSVLKPGVYPITGRTTLLQVIALASGLDQMAEENAVKIFRMTPGRAREVAVFDLEAIRSGRVEDPLIKGDDLVVVEKSGSRVFIKGFTDTLRGFIGFGTLR